MKKNSINSAPLLFLVLTLFSYAMCTHSLKLALTVNFIDTQTIRSIFVIQTFLEIIIIPILWVLYLLIIHTIIDLTSIKGSFKALLNRCIWVFLPLSFFWALTFVVLQFDLPSIELIAFSPEERIDTSRINSFNGIRAMKIASILTYITLILSLILSLKKNYSINLQRATVSALLPITIVYFISKLL